MRQAKPWAIALMLTFVNAAYGQIPDSFTNLKVLPKDIAKRTLESTMRGFSFALGVRCEHCHVERAAPEKGLDFAKDDKEPKRIARQMLQMVEAINRDFISKIDSKDDGGPISVACVTCHHGLSRPRVLSDILGSSLQHDGIDRTIALYRRLRHQYFGSGAYDFGETQLNLLTERLLAAHDSGAAVAIEELNFSANQPDSVWSYHLLAMAHQANGRVNDAIADYRAVLRIQPDDQWAESQIAALTASQPR